MDVILDVLSKATSQNPELTKIAEQQLKFLETEVGYYSMLMTVVLDRSVDVNVRWLASVCLKNGIDRYWRKSAPNAIATEERLSLKQKLLLCFDEPVNQVATQFAVIVAKIARMDFPLEWPELFPTLLNVIQRPEDLYQQRGLLVLHHVVKMLASKRLVGDQQVFQRMTVDLFPIAVHLWTNYSNAFIQKVKNAQSNHKLMLEKCLFSLKVLRKLVVYGFKKPGKEPIAMNFLMIIFQQFKPFIECRKNFYNQEGLQEICEKYLVLLAKVLTDVLEQHPSSFVQFIRPTLECAVMFCFAQECRDSMFERLTVGLLNLIKAILTCQEYKYGRVDPNKAPELKEADIIRTEFFTFPILKEMLQQLVCRYFLLTKLDIENWNENPEEFATDELGESWKYNLRPCTEVLFLSIFRAYEETLMPVILEMIKSIDSMKGTDFDTIVKKEAVFNAIGLASFNLYDDLDFDNWLTEALIPELQIVDSNYYIIRRRVIWMLGQWIDVKFSQEKKPLLYEIIIQALDAKENVVVRLAAANTLKAAVNGYEFVVEKFEPFLERTFQALFQLLKEVQECDLKMSVIHVMSFLVERVRVKNHVHSLMQYLHELWETCGDHIMLRCAIISCFSEIICSLNGIDEKLHSFLMPLVALSTDMSLPAHVYLLDDGLNLWRNIVENTSTCSSSLMDIARNIMPLLESGKETSDKGLTIMEAYILLAPKEFLERYGEKIVNTFMYVITDMIPEANLSFIDAIEVALIVFPMESSILFKPVLAVALSSVLEVEERPYNFSVRLCVLARVILSNQSCFGSLLQEKAVECGREVDSIFEYLLEIWLKKMPSVPLITQKKLLALALLSLLNFDSSIIYENICGILLAVVEVLNDVTGCENIRKSPDLLYILDTKTPENDTQSDGDSSELTEHEKRQSQNQLLDPVYTVILKDCLKSQLSALEQRVDRAKFQDMMESIDVETMQQLQHYLQL